MALFNINNDYESLVSNVLKCDRFDWLMCEPSLLVPVLKINVSEKSCSWYLIESW
jgi:hypothetical protein